MHISPHRTAPIGGLRPSGRAAVVCALLSIVALVAPGVAARAADPEVVRVSGASRYATAAAVSDAFDPGVPRVFLATGTNFPDALAATAVAGRLGAPILLVHPHELPTATRQALQRLQPRAITIIGGRSAVDQDVEEAARALTSGPVDREDGANRYETAADLVDTWFDPGVPVALVTTGTGFADALSGGPAATALDGPLVLVKHDRIPEPTRRSLARLRPGRVVVLGGSAAVSDAVVADLAAYTDGAVTRAAGSNRHTTSAATVGDAFPGAPDTVYLATGTNFPDALAGGALAGTGHSPLLTSVRDCVPQPVLDQVERIAPDRVVLLGGEQALGDGVRDLTSCADGPAVHASTIQTDLDVPWDVVFTPDGRTFLTERDLGRVVERGPDGSVDEVATFAVDNDHEGGLTGLAVSPTWDADPWLYAMYVGDTAQRVVRFRPDGSSVEVVVDDLPTGAEGNQSHFSGRIDFGPDGMLYVAVGDVRLADLAQDPTTRHGKILRYTPDGGVPADNPFVATTATPDDDPVWALGFRDPQGMAWDAEGRMYASEFGPNRDDEINRIEPGGNYGWPVTTGTRDHDPRFVLPLVVRQPPEASWSGISVLTGGAVPAWEGDLFVAALRGSRLYRVDLQDGEVVGVEERLVGTYGRLRHVTGAPDGSLWVLTSNRDDNGHPGPTDDRIVRLAP